MTQNGSPGAVAGAVTAVTAVDPAEEDAAAGLRWPSVDCGAVATTAEARAVAGAATAEAVLRPNPSTKTATAVMATLRRVGADVLLFGCTGAVPPPMGHVC